MLDEKAILVVLKDLSSVLRSNQSVRSGQGPPAAVADASTGGLPPSWAKGEEAMEEGNFDVLAAVATAVKYGDSVKQAASSGSSDPSNVCDAAPLCASASTATASYCDVESANDDGIGTSLGAAHLTVQTSFHASVGSPKRGSIDTKPAEGAVHLPGGCTDAATTQAEKHQTERSVVAAALQQQAVVPYPHAIAPPHHQWGAPAREPPLATAPHLYSASSSVPQCIYQHQVDGVFAEYRTPHHSGAMRGYHHALPPSFSFSYGATRPAHAAHILAAGNRAAGNPAPYGTQLGYPYFPAASVMPPVQCVAPVSAPLGSMTWPQHQPPPRSFAALSSPLSALTHSPLSSAPLSMAHVPAGTPAEMLPPQPRVTQTSSGYSAPPHTAAATTVAAFVVAAPAVAGPAMAPASTLAPSEAEHATCAAAADADAMKMVQESREVEACNNAVAVACLHSACLPAGEVGCELSRNLTLSAAAAAANAEAGLPTTTHAAVCAAAAYAAKAAVGCSGLGACVPAPVPMGAPSCAGAGRNRAGRDGTQFTIPGSMGKEPKLPTAKVKMTELLVVITERLDAQGEAEKAALISSTSTKYRTGELAYAQAMAVLSEAIGRDQLVQEVTRLSRQAMAANKVTATTAAGPHLFAAFAPSAQLASDVEVVGSLDY